MIHLLAHLIGSSNSQPESSKFILGGKHIISGTTYSFDNLSVQSQLYDPQLVYYNGSCYAVITKHEDVLQSKVMIKYDGTTVTVQEIGFAIDVADKDYHNVANLIIDNSGYIYVFFDKHGSTTEIYKSDNPEDISSFTKLTEELTAFANYGDYPMPMKSSLGNYYVFARKFVNGTMVYKPTPSTGLENWDTGTQITIADSNPSGNTNYRHYPSFIQSGIGLEWNYILIQKRIDFSGGPAASYYYHFLLKTKDFDTFYNYQETASFQRSIDGIQEDQYLADFRFYTADSQSALCTPSLGYIDSNENPFFVLTDNSVLKLIYYQSGWQTKILDMSSITSFLGFKILSRNTDGSFDLAVSIDGSNYKTDRYRTSDFFETFEYIENIQDETNNTWVTKLPMNYHEIPKGGKFMIITGSQKNKDNNVTTGSERNDVQIRFATK